MVLRQISSSPLTYAEVDDTPAEYLTQTEGDVRYDPLGGGGGVTDHGALTGLADDDHTQYHNDVRGDIRYYTKTANDTLLGAKSDTTHNHSHNSLTGLTTGDPHTQYAKLVGDTFTGDVTVQGSGKAYRFRRGGAALDFEGGGADMYFSIWANSDFTGTQNFGPILRTTGICDFQSAITAPKVTVGFTPAFNNVDTFQTTTSTSYTDLTTVGPSVTVTVPTGGMRVKVSLSSRMGQGSGTAQVMMSFAVSGTTTISALDDNSICHNGNGSSETFGGFTVITLNAGSNTITAKYKTNAAGTAQFTYRRLLVEPMPA